MNKIPYTKQKKVVKLVLKQNKNILNKALLSENIKSYNSEFDIKEDDEKFKQRNNNNPSFSSLNNSSKNVKENIKLDNEFLFTEINDLVKEISEFKSELNNLTEEYNKLNKNDFLKNCSFDIAEKEKEIEIDNIKLEEEKYLFKLRHLENENNLLKYINEKEMKHNKELKYYYKVYTGKEWINP